MPNLQRRKETREARNGRYRRAMFITDYIQAKHKEIYTEAEQAFDTLQQKNPHKKDLRKTVDFLRLTTPFRSRCEYYNRNKGLKKKQLRNDNMVLNIQLMRTAENLHTLPEPRTQPPSPPSPIIPDHMYESLLQDLRNDPAVATFFNNMDTEENHQITQDNDDTPSQGILNDTGESQDNNDTPLPDLSSILNDPDIASILNDTEENHQLIQGNEDLWDAHTNEMTPLERELMELGY